jgi:hypothetical protein
VSIGLDVGVLDDFAPFGIVALDLLNGLRGRQKFRVATQLLELLLQVFVLARLEQRL